jgi:hypothetical protein
MKIVFSEAQPDYSHYLYPYAIWAFPEGNETAADLFNAGFLPTRTPGRYYLCRQIRVDLGRFTPSSENRRISRKGQGIALSLLRRQEFEFSPARRGFALKYAEIRFGSGVMPRDRIDAIFDSGIVTHVLVFEEAASALELGFVFFFIQEGALGHYMYAFYDVEYLSRNLGMFMMTSAVNFFREAGYKHIYLGTCYSERALYKWQFAGCEFFNGNQWSENLEELKFLLRRQQENLPQHLLEDDRYLREFCAGDVKTNKAFRAQKEL